MKPIHDMSDNELHAAINDLMHTYYSPPTLATIVCTGANLCRYGGDVRVEGHPARYSVLEHQLHGSEQMEAHCPEATLDDLLMILLHDVPEYVIGEWPRMAKVFAPGIERCEDILLEHIIFPAHGLSGPMSDLAHAVDDRMAATEGPVFQAHRNKDWSRYGPPFPMPLPDPRFASVAHGSGRVVFYHDQRLHAAWLDRYATLQTRRVEAGILKAPVRVCKTCAMMWPVIEEVPFAEHLQKAPCAKCGGHHTTAASDRQIRQRAAQTCEAA